MDIYGCKNCDGEVYRGITFDGWFHYPNGWARCDGWYLTRQDESTMATPSYDKTVRIICDD